MIAVDRIEGQRVILDVDGETVEMPRSALPGNIKEGDTLRIEVCENVAQSLRKENEDRLERLRERDPGDMEIDL